jgi:hypothetical protein
MSVPILCTIADARCCAAKATTVIRDPRTRAVRFAACGPCIRARMAEPSPNPEPLGAVVRRVLTALRGAVTA